MILVFLLAGRNSPVQLFTFGAISFETQMLLHRWIARMVVLQAGEETEREDRRKSEREKIRGRRFVYYSSRLTKVSTF